MIIKEIKDKRSELSWTLLFQLSSLIGVITVIKLLTNYFHVDEYGKYGLTLSIIGIVNLLLYGPLGHAVLRFTSIYDSETKLATDILFFHFFVSLFLAFVLFASYLTGFIQGEWLYLITVAFIASALIGFNSNTIQFLMAKRLRKEAAVISILDNLTKIILIVLFYYLGLLTPVTVFLLIIIAALFSFAIVFRYYSFLDFKGLINNFRLILDKKKLSVESKDVFNYSSGFLWLSVAAIPILYGDRWLLQQFGGYEIVGIYIALYQISNAPLAAVYRFVSVYMIPIIYSKVGKIECDKQLNHGDRIYLVTIYSLMIFIIPITLFFYFFHEEVVEIMTNNDYANYSKIIVYIVLALSLQKIGDFMAVKGFNLNKPSVYILPRLFQSLTLIIMALFLINNHGVYGIVYSLIASSVIYIMLMAVVNNKLNKEYYS